MTDHTLIEGFDVPEYYVEGFDWYEVRENVLTCGGFRFIKHPGEQLLKVPKLSLVMPVSGAPDTIGRATAALQRIPMLAQIVKPFRGAIELGPSSRSLLLPHERSHLNAGRTVQTRGQIKRRLVFPVLNLGEVRGRDAQCLG